MSGVQSVLISSIYDIGTPVLARGIRIFESNINPVLHSPGAAADSKQICHLSRRETGFCCWNIAAEVSKEPSCEVLLEHLKRQVAGTISR